MTFENLEQANEYQEKAEKEIADLKQQLENQKTVLSEKDETIKSYDEQVKKLKIKNYELFEQIPVTGQTKTDPPKKDETEIDINYLLKNFDN